MAQGFAALMTDAAGKVTATQRYTPLGAVRLAGNGDGQNYSLTQSKPALSKGSKIAAPTGCDPTGCTPDCHEEPDGNGGMVTVCVDPGGGGGSSGGGSSGGGSSGGSSGSEVDNYEPPPYVEPPASSYPYEAYTPSYSDPAYETYQSQDTASEAISQGYGGADQTGSVFDAFIDAAVNVVSAVVDAILPVQTASASSEVASAEFGGGEPPASGLPIVDAFETYVDYKLAETVAPDEPLYDNLSAQKQGQVLGIQTLTDIVTNTPSVVSNAITDTANTIWENREEIADTLGDVATAMDVISLTATTAAAGLAMTGVGLPAVPVLLGVAEAAGLVGLMASGMSDIFEGNTVVDFNVGYFQVGTATLTDLVGAAFPAVPNSRTAETVIENLPTYRGGSLYGWHFDFYRTT